MHTNKLIAEGMTKKDATSLGRKLRSEGIDAYLMRADRAKEWLPWLNLTSTKGFVVYVIQPVAH